MPCIPLISKGRVTGYVCVSAGPYHVCKGVWMEWHNYLGPSFWKDRACSTPIDDWYEQPRIVAAFDNWIAKHPEHQPKTNENDKTVVLELPPEE